MIELAFAVFLLIGAGGNGHYLLRKLVVSDGNRTERLCFSLAIGLGSLILPMLALGLTHLFYTWIIWLLVLSWAIVGSREVWLHQLVIKQFITSLRPKVGSVFFWIGVLLLLGMGVNLIRAMAPPHGATDPLAYQLALPKIYLQKHFLSFEPSITGTLYPTNMGLLYLVSIGLRNGVLAQVVHWMTGALTALVIIGFSQRYFNWQVGLWGATLFSFIPIVVVFGPLGYVDVGLCFFQFMAFWALFNWLEKPEKENLVLAAVLTGLSMGIKHQGIATWVLGGAIVLGGGAMRRAGLRQIATELLLFSGLALLLVGPWYLRAFLMAGNPIWPLANGFFRGFPYGMPPDLLAHGWGISSEHGVLGKLLPSADWFVAYWQSMSPWNWTFRPTGSQKAIGVFFVALIPGLLLYGRSRKALLLIGFCLVYYAILVRVLHMNPRYGLVLFAFLSVLCGLVAEQLSTSRTKAIALLFKSTMAIAILFNLIWAFTLAKPLLKVALGGESREHFLTAKEPNYRVFQFINQQLPESAKILFQGIVKGYYCERAYLWDHPYPAVINYQAYETPELLLERLRELEVSHMVRMKEVPSYRLGTFPQYFQDPYHEAFRTKYLKVIYYDESFMLFEVVYGKG